MLMGTCLCLNGYAPPEIPYAPAAGQPGSTAIAFDSEGFKGWATGIIAVDYGSNVSAEFRTPAAALGAASGVAPDVLVLGRGGSVILEFRPGIADGEGPDFAVFENAFRENFLELAYVEVSSDGLHFVRFPNYSLTSEPVGGFGDVQPSFVHGLAGKYRAGYGTPFDLSILGEAYEAALVGEGGFTSGFRTQLVENYPSLDSSKVKYVRIVDIVGDGNSLDCEGFAIYDPYPTVITAGFDLDAVGILNLAEADTVSFSEWAGGFGIDPIPGDDADHDKWNNQMEYLFGSDPLQSDSIPDVKMSLSPEGVFILEFWRNLSSDSAPRIEISLDGISWLEDSSNDLGQVDLAEVRDGLQMGRIEARFPNAGSGLFVRFVSAP
jgi:hypothetical protein